MNQSVPIEEIVIDTASAQSSAGNHHPQHSAAEAVLSAAKG